MPLERGAIAILDSKDNQKIGVVYTPEYWATWAIRKFEILDLWAAGSTVVDPTVGDGSFVRSLVSEAQDRGVPISQKMISNLYGFDIREEGIKDLAGYLHQTMNLSVSETNFKRLDVILDSLPKKFDIVMGNPPWANFTTLPSEYKQLLKPKYIEYGLTSKTHSTLLGNSRIDIAALVVSRMMADGLNENGKLLMFLPTSIFDGIAHEPFRKFETKQTLYFLNSLFDFGNEGIFSSGGLHGTNFAFAEFSLEPSPDEFVPEFRRIEEGWERVQGRLLPSTPTMQVNQLGGLISIGADSKPRQGTNTCGANGVFFGDVVDGSIEDKTLIFRSLDGVESEIESSLVFPLVMRDNLLSSEVSPSRFVLLPYDSITGKPLTESQMDLLPNSKKYFSSQKDRLESRKGTLIRSSMKNYGYWSLLGVGKYSFAPFKLIWLTAGQSKFEPRVVSSYAGKPWQANQSLQAFMPFQDLWSAEETASLMVEKLGNVGLGLLGTPKSLSWAQPGRVGKLLTFSSRSDKSLTHLF